MQLKKGKYIWKAAIVANSCLNVMFPSIRAMVIDEFQKATDNFTLGRQF